MTKVATNLGKGVVMISRVRLQKCAWNEQGCGKKTRMFLVMPLADIGEDGGPGLGGLTVCSDHIEEAIVRLTS